MIESPRDIADRRRGPSGWSCVFGCVEIERIAGEIIEILAVTNDWNAIVSIDTLKQRIGRNWDYDSHHEHSDGTKCRAIGDLLRPDGRVTQWFVGRACAPNEELPS